MKGQMEQIQPRSRGRDSKINMSLLGVYWNRSDGDDVGQDGGGAQFWMSVKGLGRIC